MPPPPLMQHSGCAFNGPPPHLMPLSKINEYIQYLNGVNVLPHLRQFEKKGMAKSMTERHFTKGELIHSQGDIACSFYVLFDGKVNIIKDGMTVHELVASVPNGTVQYFGEEPLLAVRNFDVPHFDFIRRKVRVKVTSENAKTLVLNAVGFPIGV